MTWGKLVAVLLVGTAALGLHACSSGCDQETVDRAVAFLESHQACESDDDCVVVGDYCEELPGGYCGQLTMNRAGLESAEWQAIAADLEGCAPSECTVCLAALVPGCANGSCGGP
ncbi:MAG TPA: hypothetical protein VGK73_01330 [Polyangiaceae bacterium]